LLNEVKLNFKIGCASRSSVLRPLPHLRPQMSLALTEKAMDLANRNLVMYYQIMMQGFTLIVVTAI